MKISRRSFFTKSVQLAAVAFVAPIALKFSKASATAPIPPKPKPELKKVFKCSDFAPQITIQDYSPGQTIKLQDLSKKERSCAECMYDNKCTAEGNKFIKETRELAPWSRKLQRKFYDQSFLGKIT